MESLSKPTIPSAQKVAQLIRATEESHITKPLCNASLFVTGLDVSVTEACLQDLFLDFGKVLSVKICRDDSSHASQGRAYVNYDSLRDATEALKSMDFKVIKGKPIRVMFSSRNFGCGGPTVFFKNYPSSIGIKVIEKIFSRFGTIMASELARDCKGRSKGFGFVMFDRFEAAKKAITSVHGSVMRNRLVYASHFLCKETRDHERKKFQHFPTLYVSNFHEEISEVEVFSVFNQYGSVLDVNIIKEPDFGSIRKPLNEGFGFVVFENLDDAVSAIKGLNGKRPSKIKELDPMLVNGDRVWYVGWAKSMFKRKIWQKVSICENVSQEMLTKLEGTDLYIKNLDDNLSCKFLKNLFSEFGVIDSKVIYDSQGRRRGCAFVTFAIPEDATKAMNAMNGKLVGRKSLHISVAKRKGRKADPQAKAHIAHPHEILPYLYENEPTEEKEKSILRFTGGKRPIEGYIAESLNDFLGLSYYCGVCGCIFDQAEKTRDHITTYHTFITRAMVS